MKVSINLISISPPLFLMGSFFLRKWKQFYMNSMSNNKIQNVWFQWNIYVVKGIVVPSVRTSKLVELYGDDSDECLHTRHPKRSRCMTNTQGCSLNESVLHAALFKEERESFNYLFTELLSLPLQFDSYCCVTLKALLPCILYLHLYLVCHMADTCRLIKSTGKAETAVKLTCMSLDGKQAQMQKLFTTETGEMTATTTPLHPLKKPTYNTLYMMM